MNTSQHCRPPYHAFKPASCLPGVQTLSLLLLLIVCLLLAGIITTLTGFEAAGMLIFGCGVTVVIGAASYFFIRCHASAVTVQLQLLTELHHLQETINAQQNLGSKQHDSRHLNHDNPQQPLHTALHHSPSNDDEIRHLHRLIQDLENKKNHHQ